MPERYEAVVIGSGFGGSITACRMSKKWPGQVLILERGRRYPMGSFPRNPHDFSRNFWNLPDEKRGRPDAFGDQEQHGLFDIRNFREMDAVLCAGLGGGSLIYANVFLIPPDEVWDSRWPASCAKKALLPYYQVAKEVLGSRPIPTGTGDPRRDITRTKFFQRAAQAMGRNSELLDLNVFFGNDFNKPLPIGEQARNRYGALQTSCTYCGECDVGCNTHSKNTLDLNYLHVAEHRYNAKIQTEQLAESIAPLNDKGQDDPSASGEHGYRVYYLDLRNGRVRRTAIANRVVVSAGTLGTTELLLRCRQVHRTLNRLSGRLGEDFSGNGDFLSFVLGSRDPSNPNYGPVITQRTDFNLYDKFDRDRAFVLEDASYPPFLAWLVEGLKPRIANLGAIERALRALFGRWMRGESTTSMGYILSDILSGDVSYRTSVLLCMGIDKSNGKMTLDSSDRISVDWPGKDSQALYDAVVKAREQFQKVTEASAAFALPTWYLRPRKNVTVHALGGCVLADDPGKGVSSAARGNFGELFGYKNLYVADGAVVPSAVGANPTATIAALSELVAEGITGIQPDSNL